MYRVYYKIFFVLLILVFIGCAGKSTTLHLSDPTTSPPSSQEIVFPNGMITGGGSQEQAAKLAEILVKSHNMAVRQREKLRKSQECNQLVIQKLREEYEKNMASAQMAYKLIQELAARQGAGEITIFFPVNSSKIVKDSSEYKRLVRFADYLSRECHGRTVNFVLVGSASAFGPESINEQLAKERASAPVRILDHYLVNVPHKYYKVYGTGDEFSPENVPLYKHLRYQHVHITAFYGKEMPLTTKKKVIYEKAKKPCIIQKGTAENKQRFTNSLGMEFVYIPGGSFVMGSPEDEWRRNENEYQHKVTLTQGFSMQTTEVTQGQWKKVMGDNPSHFLNCGDSCPVENVNWYQVQDFIKKLNEMENTKSYRLPTEAEWEYACRAGGKSAFGSAEIESECKECGYSNQLDQVGWYFRNSDQGTHPVGQKKPNAWGLYDMHGNVWEWCQDWHGKYPFHSVTDPTGPETGLSKIRRGGSWSHYPMFCRSAYRSWVDPDNRFPEVGFRLVKEAQKITTCTDSDCDGVCDSEDKCPGTPYGVKVDTKGCPSETQKVSETECIVLRDIIFDFDSARIKKNMVPVLNKVVEVIKERSRPILIEGHTSSIGSTAYNQDLSIRRAESVKRFLIQHGIPADTIQIKGYGETRPKYNNSTPEGRSLNRRVEIYFQ